MAQYYDLFAAADAQPGAELSFLRTLLPVRASVLDIGAGTGLLAFALATAGYCVTALEPDPEMYAALLVRLGLRRDLQETLSPVPKALGFDLGQGFDACLCISVLHLLDEQARVALFRYARSMLRAGGRFVLETPVESPVRAGRPRQRSAERTFGNTRFEHYTTMDRTTGGRWCTTWEFFSWRGDQLLDRCTRVFDWKPSSLGEVRQHAEAAGLVLEGTCAGFDGTPFIDGESPILLAVLADRP